MRCDFYLNDNKDQNYKYCIYFYDSDLYNYWKYFLSCYFLVCICNYFYVLKCFLKILLIFFIKEGLVLFCEIIVL